MNEKTRIWVWLIVSVMVWGVYGFGAQLELVLKKEVVLGNTGDPFFSLYSICEDDEANIYVLDKKRCNVRKFSGQGKELLKFGQKGEGPGDFKAPKKLYYSKQIGVTVTEAMNDASIFTTGGELVKKINFAAKMGFLFNIRSIGGEIFYADQQRENEFCYQILMDAEGKKINTELFASSGWNVSMKDG